MFDYPAILTPDDNGTVLVTFPDVPEAITFGDDEEDALCQAVDALETALSFYVEARRPLPARATAGPNTSAAAWATVRRSTWLRPWA